MIPRSRGGGTIRRTRVVVDDDEVNASAALALAAHSAPSREHGYEGYELQNVRRALVARRWWGGPVTDTRAWTYPRSPAGAELPRETANYEVGREMIRLLGVDPAVGYEAFAARMAAQNAPPSPPPYGR